MTDLLARLLDLHTRRAGSWFLDGQHHGQVSWPDMCAHCGARWPCETVRIVEEET